MFALVSIISCTKDFDEIIIDQYDFELTETHSEKGFIYEPISTNYLITPEKYISTVDYFVSYSYSKGEGYYLTAKGDTIKPETTIKLDSLNMPYRYMAVDTGAHAVNFKGWDSNGIEHSLEVLYTIEYAPFQFILNKGNKDFIINANNDIEFIISRDKNTAAPNKEEESQTFKVVYQIQNGSATILIGEKEYKPGETFSLLEEATKLPYKPITLGEHTIIATATAPDGATREVTLKVNVRHLEFSLDATAEAISTELNTDLPINVALSNENEESDVTYQTTFSYSSDSKGSGTLIDENNAELKAGEYFDMELGAYKYIFKSQDLGKKKIYFDTKDSNGQVKRDSVEITIGNVPFVFTGSSENKTIFVNQKTKLNFSLKATGNTENIDYSIAYEILKGNGALVDQNNTIIESTKGTNVDLGEFSFYYTPETLGAHSLKLVVTDNYGQASDPILIDLTATNLDIAFSVTNDDPEIKVKDQGNLSVSLIEKNNYEGVTYELSYVISGGNAKLFENGSELTPSEFFSVKPGSWDYQLVAETPGTYEVSWILRDSNGQIVDDQKTTTIVVKNDFTITATPSPASEFVNKKVSLIVELKEIPEGANETYEGFYSSNKNGVLIVAGDEYTPGSKFPLEVGTNILEYRGTEKDTHEIVLTVESSAGYTHSAQANVNFQELDFNFIGNAENTGISIGQSTGLNFNTSSDQPSSYKMRFTISGNAVIKDHNGEEVMPGQLFEIPTGNFSWNFEAVTEGKIDMVFYAQNDTGKEKEVPISITVTPKDFSLFAEPVNLSAFVNESVDINVTIDEIPDNANEEYKLFYSLNNTGTLEYGGNSYAPGTAINVVKGINTFTYTGFEKGTHTVNFTVNSTANKSHDASVSIDFKEADFNFTGEVSKTEFSVGQTSDITMNINEIDGNSTYKGRFTINGTATITDHNGNVINSNDIVDIPSGNFTWRIEGTTSNDVNLVIYAKNATGKEKQINKSFQINEKEYNFTATPAKTSASTNESVDILLEVEEIGIGGDTYTVYYSNSSNGYITYNGNDYYPGEKINISAGNTAVTYTPTLDQDATHSLEFNALSSSGVAKSKSVMIYFEKFLEPFTLNVSQGSGDKKEGEPFTLNVITNASSGHDAMVDYQLAFTFSGVTGGTITYKGQTYSTGQNIPIDYGAISMEFTPTTDEDFTINFNGTNSTGQSASTTTSVVIVKKPIVFTKGEKHNVSCGGWNGCDYESRVYICWSEACSETFDGAIIQSIHISVKNSSTGNYENHTFSPGDAYGNDGDRYFVLEKFGKESSLNYKNQPYDIYIIDSNGNKSDPQSGTIAG